MTAAIRARSTPAFARGNGSRACRGDRIRVLVADDHAVVREGIKSMLAAAPDMVVVAEAENGVEAAEQARLHLPDVVVLDVQMPGGGGLETLRALRGAPGDVAVLLLSFHAETVFAIPFLREGAHGYLSKENAADHLLDAIRRVSRGGRYVSPAVAEHLARVTAHERPEPHHDLSAEELVVLSLLAAGKSPEAAGADLLLSRRAIQRSVGRILVKTGLPNQTALIQYALAEGIAVLGVGGPPPHGL